MKIITLISVILLTLISCKSNKEYDSIIFKNLNSTKDYEINTVIENKDRFVVRLGLIINGNIEKDGVLEIGSTPNNRFDKIKLKKGSVNKSLEMDWYEPNALVRYKPSSLKDSLKDSLNVQYLSLIHI